MFIEHIERIEMKFSGDLQFAILPQVHLRCVNKTLRSYSSWLQMICRRYNIEYENFTCSKWLNKMSD